MRTHLLAVGLILLAVVVAMAAAQTRPKLSRTFEMTGVVHTTYKGNFSFWAEGLFAADHEANRGVQSIVYAGYTHLNVLEISRYDLHKVYSVVDGLCQANDLIGNIPDFWGWLQHADFSHNVTEYGQVFNVWRFVTAGYTLEATVPADDPTTLAVYSTIAAKTFTFYVQRFNDKPKAEWFDVPKECGASKEPSTFVPVH